MITFTRKIGQNRGKPRLWIEGRHLLDSGLTHGTQWRIVYFADGFDIVADTEGPRRVAGKPDRPIIDINGKGPLTPFEGCKSVVVKYNKASGCLHVRKG